MVDITTGICPKCGSDSIEKEDGEPYDIIIDEYIENYYCTVCKCSFQEIYNVKIREVKIK